MPASAKPPNPRRFLLALFLMCGLAVPVAATASVLHVENFGQNGSSCGADITPCATITQAILLAVDGDTVVVGPGRYGDLNENGILGESGEEPDSCGGTCMILLDKRLTIESSAGSDSTFIRGFHGRDTIRMTASHAVFGGKAKGFTIYGSRMGVRIMPGVTGVRIEGNVATAVSVGFSLDRAADGNHLIGNRTWGTEKGFEVFSTANTLKGNTAGENGDSGFTIWNDGNQVSENMMIANAHGIRIRQQTADSGRPNTIEKNTFVGSDYSGVHVWDDVGAVGSAPTIRMNNIYSNGRLALFNCGVYNSAFNGMDATNNFWGAASGPGPDPADMVCDESSATTVTTPFAARAFAAATSSVTVQSPAGGEMWPIGSAQNIVWTASNVPGDVKIDVSRDGGASWTAIAGTPNDGSHSWTVSGPATTQARIRVTSVADPTVADVSNANVTIDAGRITVQAPNGAETWPIGSVQNIAWTPSGVTGNVRIEISRNAGTSWTTILGNTPNDGVHPWTVTGPATTQARVRITSLTDSTMVDVSNANATIGGGRITLLSPNGGETWAVGSIQSIAWSSTGIVGDVRFEVSRNGGTTWTTVLGNTPNDGVHPWTVTGPATTQARVRITSVTDPTVSGPTTGNIKIQ